MGLIASAYARLSQPDAVRAQVLAHLALARVHNLVKSSYEQYLASSSSGESGGRDTVTGRQQPVESKPRKNRKQQDDTQTQLTRRKQRNHKQLGKQTSRRGKADERDWDWRGFPIMWRQLALYEYLSIGWMSLASVRTIFREQLDALVSPLSRWLMNGRRGSCLLMGRIVKPLNISESLTVLMSSWHLVWRLVQARTKRTRLITMTVFLLASEQDLERVYASLEAKDRQFARLNNYPLDKDDELFQTELVRSVSPSAPIIHAPGDTSGDQNERLFRQVMCYQVHRNRRIYFRLRPNRTREARELLGRRMAAVSLASIIFFTIVFIIGLTLMLTCIFSDYRYARVYPGCDPLFDDRLARGELAYLASFTLSGHHLLSACVDILENAIFWLDSGMSLTFVPTFSYMLNYDLLLYWSELDKKLKSLTQRSKHMHLSRRTLDDFAPTNDELKTSESVREDPHPSPPLCQLESLRALESDIHELQFEIFDFFHQIRHADMIVGDTLTNAIHIWLSGCAFVNYNLLMEEEKSLYTSLITELVLILGFCVLSLATFHLLELRRRCLRSYRTLCSLMAYDRTRKKRSFIKLLDFYLVMGNSITYHVMRTYAYEPTTFITIIGWSFSCFFIAFTLFEPHGYIP